MSLDSFPQNTPSAEKEKLLEAIGIHGRLAIHTYASRELAGLKQRPSPGWSSLTDGKPNNLAMSRICCSMEKKSSDFLPSTGVSSFDFDGLMRAERLDAAIALAPETYKEPIMEEKTESVSKGWFRAAETKKVSVRTGERDVPLKASEINGKSEDTENAYRVVYHRVDVPDTVGRRGAVTFTARIVLPEHLARETYKFLESNPEAVGVILQKLDPEMFRVLSYVPVHARRLLVIPESGADSVYAIENHTVRGIKSEYVKEI